MENSEDKLLKEFFEKNKVEIQDKGFSTRLMHKLPEKERNTGWIVPMFTLIGIIISMFLVDIWGVIYKLYEIFVGIPLIYMMAGIMFFPIVILFLYLYRESESAY